MQFEQGKDIGPLTVLYMYKQPLEMEKQQQHEKKQVREEGGLIV